MKDQLIQFCRNVLLWFLQLVDMEEFFQQESAQWADDLALKDSELQKLRDDFDKMYSSRCQELDAQRSNLPNNQEQQTL